jgi:hypothetical protein
VSIRLVEQLKPFRIPSDLREILTTMPLEYGTGGGIGAELPAVRLWIVIDEDGIAGYAWLVENLGPEEAELYVNIAVLPHRKGHGTASCALLSIEQTLKDEFVPALYCQVNSNRAETGRWVRQWLLRYGFELLRRDIPDHYATYSNAELSCTYPGPVCFRKALIGSDAQPSLSGDTSQAAHT